jgi:hypothetical protein
MVEAIKFTAEQIHAACDQLATPPKAKKPLASLAKSTPNLEPYIKEQMPSTKGLAREPLDAVAYANPLGYLPEIRALADKGADSHGLLGWTGQMEAIAVYAAARVLERVITARKPTKARSFKVADEDTRVVAGNLDVTGDLRNGGVLVVLGDLTVGGVCWDREPGCQLVVLGDVTVRGANLSGGLAVRGDLTCSAALFANDHGSTLFVGGAVATPLLVLEDKSLRAKSITAKLTLDSRTLRKADVTRAKKLLVDQVLRDEDDDDDGDETFPLDIEAFLGRLMKGQPLLR